MHSAHIHQHLNENSQWSCLKGPPLGIREMFLHDIQVTPDSLAQGDHNSTQFKNTDQCGIDNKKCLQNEDWS